MKKVPYKLLLVSLLLLCSAAPLLAQKPNVKFGKISLEELKMQVYAKDTAAGAIILFDQGQFYGSSFSFSRFTRFKILKPSGLDRANIVVYAPFKSNVSAYIYNLSETGEIIKEKLKSSAIYEDNIVDDLYVFKVALPNVKVGTVVDFEYKHMGLPFQWEFQDMIPTVWSELKIEPSVYFNYQKNMYGSEPLFINESYYWAAKDVPALRPEPYMGSPKNQITRFEFEIISMRGVSYDGSSWKGIAEILMRSPLFGHQINGNAFLNSIADSISRTSQTDLEKVQKAVAHIKRNMVWNGSEYFLTRDLLSEQYKKKRPSSSATINLTLVSLLKKLKLQAHPLVMSTRDNGFLSPVYPSPNKLNHVIAYVKINEEEYLLDATEKNAPLGLLPVKCLNLHGRIIGDDLYAPVQLEPKHKYKKTYFSQLSLSDNLQAVTYQLTVSSDAYAALEKRDMLTAGDYNEEARKSEFENQFNVVVNDYQLQDKEQLDKPLVEKMVLQQPVNKSGNFIFLNPVVGQSFSSNPFYLEQRLYPLDFIYPISEKYFATIAVPEAYEVESLPESVSMLLPDQGGRLLYQISSSGNTIQLTYHFEINKRLFQNTSYPEVKRIFDHYINKTKEQVVLKKKLAVNATASPTSSIDH